ncbi:MAG: hypothetical protein NVS3B7_01280 [Candidatus Elarobacter sp.]
MKYLVFCACGHGLDRHGATGCAGENRVLCGCTRDQDRALESAVDEARTHPWGAWRAGAAGPAAANSGAAGDSE